MVSKEVHLDGHSATALAVFILVMVPVLHPVHIPLGLVCLKIARFLTSGCAILFRPYQCHVLIDRLNPRIRPWLVPLDLTTAPPIGVVILLAGGTITGSTIKDSILGVDGNKPYNVIILFISLAYMATAIDSSGALQALAFYISKQSRGSGTRLYVMLYLFFFVTAMIFGNDPVILSGTAFLAYFTRVTGIAPPTAWIFMEFIAANIASAVLVSSNPTNVLIAQAFRLHFIAGFTKFTLLPSVVAAVAALPLLYGMFKANLVMTWPPQTRQTVTYIAQHIDSPDVRPSSAIIDKSGAYFHTLSLAIVLVLLVGTSFMKGVEVWMITLGGGCVSLIRDVAYDMKRSRRTRQVNSRNSMIRPVAETSSHPLAPLYPSPPRDLTPQAGSNLQRSTSGMFVEDNMTTLRTCHHAEAARQRHHSPHMFRMWHASIQAYLPMTSHTISKLPMNLLPFIISMFILVRALVHVGWVPIFANSLSKICTSPSSTVFIIGFLTSLVLCPLCGTNIGATILIVEIISSPQFATSSHVQNDPRILNAAIYSSALASNLGAFSPSVASSLAGLLWINILRQKHIIVRHKEFAAWNLVPVVTLTAISMSIILLQVIYF